MLKNRSRSAVLLTALAGLVLGLAPSAVANVTGTANPGVGETLRVRSAPNTTSTIVTSIAHGASLSIICKTTGTSVNGNTQWDKLSNGYVAHAFVSSSATIPACSSTPAPTTPQGKVNVAPGDTLKVRSAPNTTSTIVTQLAAGTAITIQCRTTGTSVNGNTQWDKLSNGYVSHAYVTMTNSVPIPTCTSTTPPPATGVRATFIARADWWHRASNGQISGVAGFGRNPSLTATEPPPGTAKYRRDCSGLIAMAWQLGAGNQPSSQGLNSSAYTRAVNVTNLQAGDILTTNQSSGGHVTMFEKWANKSLWQYYAYDFGGGSGGAGPMEHKIYTLTGVSGNKAKRVNDSRQYYAYSSIKAP